jgi:hypothetical protein
MNNPFLFCLFLLHITVTNTMDIIPNDLMKTLPDTIILYYIGPSLNRLNRNNFRCTDKRNSQLLIPQDKLNDNYAQACKNNDIKLMALWRKQGALEHYEEVCKLALDKTNTLDTPNNTLDTPATILAIKLWNKGVKEDGFSYAIKHDNLDFISWILKTIKPAYYSNEMKSALALSETLNDKKIHVLLFNYRDDEQYYNNRSKEPYYGHWPHSPFA